MGYQNRELRFMLNNVPYIWFSLRAEEDTGIIRPGDDILLRFALLAHPNITPATANMGDFLAVYDKNLLWRANLFVDDRYNEINQQIIPDKIDWNTANPWNDPDNEWQMYIDYSDPLNPGNQLDSNGIQVPFLQWTHPDIEFDVDGVIYDTYAGPVYSGVAYSWDNYGWTQSSFPEFNRRMNEQVIASEYEDGSNQNELSLAPNDIWLDYDHDSYMSALGIYNHVDRIDGSPDLDLLDAGINCTQLVLHAKTYTIGQMYVDGTTFDADDPTNPANSFYIVGDIDDVQGEGVHGNINLLIPGDIIRCGTGSHWAIVQNITYASPQTRETSNALINIIHSATFNDLWAVQKGETLATLDRHNTHVYLLGPAIN